MKKGLLVLFAAAVFSVYPSATATAVQTISHAVQAFLKGAHQLKPAKSSPMCTFATKDLSGGIDWTIGHKQERIYKS